MPSEALVNSVKQIIALAKNGDPEGANAAYGVLFTSPEFATYTPEDQRQALKLFVLAKRGNVISDAVTGSLKSAMSPLGVLVEAHQDPADYEMLGVCHQLLGDDPSAAKMYRAGLDRERADRPGSDLCGRLMKRLAET